VPEPNDFTEPPTSFLIGTDVATNLPGALDRDGVFLAWQNLLSARNRTMTPPQKRRLLQDLTGSPWPTRVRFVANGGEGILHREGGTGAVPVKYLTGAKKEAVIAVHQDGTAAALKMEPAKDAIARGAQVLLVDLFNTGAAAKPASGRHGDHLVFHYSDDANQVQDLVTAAAWLATKGAKSVRLLCGEGTVEVCRLAAAIAPVPLKVEPASPQRRALKIPGLLAAGYSSH
jgi:hypothetical protein